MTMTEDALPAMREAIVGADVAVDGELLRGHAVLVADGRIRAVVRGGDVPADYPVRHVGPGILSPGFVDLHSHGAGGRGYNEADPDAYIAALTSSLRAGVTTILPTLSSAPLEQMLAAIDVFSALPSHAALPRTPGLHLEGPYFAHAQRGAQPPDALRSPDDGSVDRILERADVLRMISFAPELPGAVELTTRLVRLGIVAAAGHSDGRDTDLEACQRAGLSHVIHVVSGQSTTVRQGPWRRPGMLEATLASDDLTVEMIADGKHLPVTLMRLVVRCLSGRVCIVSDSTPGAGLPDGRHYRLGHKEFIVEDGVGMTMDRTSFAGSSTLVPQMLPIVVDQVGVDPIDAIAMMTSIPAAAARLDDVGRIAAGYHADLVVLNESLEPQAVALGGVWQ